LTVNPYFKDSFSSPADQRLIQNLNNESLKAKGRDILYIPRELVAFDRLYGEDKLSHFERYFSIEMYIENFTGFGGQREFISKFGLEIRDEITLVVSKERFNDEVVSKYPTPYILRPREGDLVYFPLDESLFEITFCDNKSVFYQLGKLFNYRIFCKRFELAAESFNTGVNKIDQLQSTVGNTTQIGITTPSSLVNVTLVLVNIGLTQASFKAGEMVYQGPTPLNATWSATVVNFAQSTNVLIVNNVKGEIDNTDAINGVTSGAVYAVVPNYEGAITEPSNTTDPAEQNTDFVNFDQTGNIVDPTNNPLSF